MAATDDIAQRKAAFRKELLERRGQLAPEERAAVDAAIARHVAESPLFCDAAAVFAYVSVGAEVDTRALIRAALGCGKLVAVPRCVPGTRLMEWHRITALGDLRPSAFGIPEPEPLPQTLVDLFDCPSTNTALALVPGLAFDHAGFRLGYGGGYYDRFLAQFPGATLGLARKAFLFPSLDILGVLEPCDQPVGWLATEQALTTTGAPISRGSRTI